MVESFYSETWQSSACGRRKNIAWSNKIIKREVTVWVVEYKYGDVAELVEGTSLLTRRSFTGTVGSNPTVSAK